MKAWMSMAAVAALVGSAAYAGLATARAEARPLDSGRYGVEAACEPKATFLECGVSIRDLVYDTILLNQKLSFTPGGALGGGLVFDGNAAKGPKQTVAIQLDPAAVGQGPSALARGRFLVEVKEGTNVVQRYSFVVPVSAK
jgi:hypothetical protein